MVCFGLGFFVGVMQLGLNPNLLGAVTAHVFSGGYTLWNNASCTRVTTLLYPVASHSFFIGYYIFFL